MAERANTGTGFGLPHVQPPITITAGHVLAIGAEPDSGHPVGVLLYLMHDLAGFSRKDAQETIWPTMSYKALVRADVTGQHRIQIITDLQDFFSLGDIPHGRMTNICTSPSANHQ